MRWSCEARQNWTHFSSVMATTPHESTPDKRRKDDNAFRAEALRLVRESRSTRAAAYQLGIGERLLYRWQEQQPARARWWAGTCARRWLKAW